MRKSLILGVAGSPRKGGNSETLLDWALGSAAENGARVEKIRVCDLKFNGCLNCGWCATHGECIQKDDMQLVYPKYLEADRIVLSTPMFFMNMPSQMKAFVDRFQCMWSKRYVLERELRAPGRNPKGHLLALGGTKGASLFNGIDLLVKCFYSITGVAFDADNSLYYRSIDAKGDIDRHETARDDARRLGEIIADFED